MRRAWSAESSGPRMGASPPRSVRGIPWMLRSRSVSSEPLTPTARSRSASSTRTTNAPSSGSHPVMAGRSRGRVPLGSRARPRRTSMAAMRALAATASSRVRLGALSAVRFASATTSWSSCTELTLRTRDRRRAPSARRRRVPSAASSSSSSRRRSRPMSGSAASWSSRPPGRVRRPSGPVRLPFRKGSTSGRELPMSTLWHTSRRPYRTPSSDTTSRRATASMSRSWSASTSRSRPERPLSGKIIKYSYVGCTPGSPPWWASV
mmetsp:Transcript_1422/g.4486  ORF Transcript_1422/g.4486 Transcript_1422/m.4486 type:complete len:264 (-) Transcript_1422:299-1090(-)